MTKFIIVSNYKASHKRAYVKGWDRSFNEGEGLSTGCQIENYLVDELNDYSYGKVPVGAGKKIARDIGVRVGDATCIVVSESAKKKIVKHFAPELNTTFWIKEVVL